MDLYKANVIKADEVIDSGRPVSLLSVFTDKEVVATDIPANTEPPIPKQTQQEKMRAEMELHLSKVSDECYRKGFTEGVEFQKKELLPVLDAISAMTVKIPRIEKDIIAKSEEHIVKLALAIAERVINQEVATNKEIILGVLRGVLKNISETEGMKIRLNPQDFRHIMEVKKDFLQSVDGVRNVVFEEDASIKRGGVVVETMFGEVDARLESQLKEIREAMLKL